jgi:hypothetical protein
VTGPPAASARAVVAPAPSASFADPAPRGPAGSASALSDRPVDDKPAADVVPAERRAARARLRGWSVTAAVTAWLLALATIALVVGAPFGVEPLVWLWVLVPVAAIDSLSALVSTVCSFERGAKVAWTLALLALAGASMPALFAHVLAPAVGVPVAIVAPIAAFWLFVDGHTED